MNRQRLTHYHSLHNKDQAQSYDRANHEYELQLMQSAPRRKMSSAPRAAWLRNVPNPVTYVWRETVKDLRYIGWPRMVEVTCNHVLPIFAMMSLLAIVISLAVIQPVNQSQRFCGPDGTSIYSVDGYNPWNSSETFSINMGLGRLSFGQAKLIDVIWDTTIGRGGQALLAFASYRVLTSALSLLMEQGPVTFGAFEAITLDGGTMWSIGKLVRDLRRDKHTRSRILIPLMVLSIILVSVFPILASAMTGYSANFDVQFTVSNGSTIPIAALQKVWYVIYDGSRLGQGFYDGYPITDYDENGPELDRGYTRLDRSFSAQAFEKSRPTWMPGCSRFAPGKVNKNGTISLRTGNTASPLRCQLLWNMSLYTNTYGLLGLYDDTSSFFNPYEQRQVSLPSPSLNVTMHMPYKLYRSAYVVDWLFSISDIAWSIVPFGITWYEHAPGREYYDLHFSRHGLTEWFAYQRDQNSSQIVDSDAIALNLTCRQQSPGADAIITYQWGFAFQLLIAFTVLLLLWTIITYAMHIHVRRHSQLVEQHRTIGLKRAVLDLAPVYQNCIADQETSMYNEKQLQKVVKSGHISYAELVRLHPATMRSQRTREGRRAFSFRKWLRREWICLLLMLFAIMLIPLGSMTPTRIAFDRRAVPPLVVGFVPVLMAGEGHFSRWLLYLPFLTAFLGVQLTIVAIRK